jgi:predicted AlkP superfamily phosphohydrolase/phosphomutase
MNKLASLLAAFLAICTVCTILDAETGASGHPKVIVIGFDGMDPFLTEEMMDAGELPNLAALRAKNGYRHLATSNPPQSPVAWATFINGAGPGTHGIFDFIHRDPSKQCAPYYSAAETVDGRGYIEYRDHRLQLSFWPFNHSPTQTLLRREGVPFWAYLDEAGIPSSFYDLPANYPPSESSKGHHRCLCGMGVPDLLGTYGTYQHFSEDGPVRTREEPGGQRTMLFFENETAPGKLTGPEDSFLKEPKAVEVDFLVHRDVEADAAVIEIQDHKVVLERGQWSEWLQIDFPLSLPAPIPDEHVSGICRFYLQEVAPNFRLYVTPINIDPSKPAVPIAEPSHFSEEISETLGLFYTAGFQEDHKALSNQVFDDAEYARQAQIVLDERLELLDYALQNYEDGLLFFYFSSTDLQAHMFWWDSDDPHPVRSPEEARKYHEYIRELYRLADGVVADVIKEHGDDSTIIVMSDHGFCNFERQFNVNTWLRDNGYIQPADCRSLLDGSVDWSKTTAYSLGLNGIYLNLKGRERDGIVEEEDADRLMKEIIAGLEAVRDTDGSPVIRNVYRSDEEYSGEHTYLAPDLLVGYYRGYRASWSCTLGDMDEEMLRDNDTAWSADHCIDPLEVPGVLFSNRPIQAEAPSLIDIAPTILNAFGVEAPPIMKGDLLFKASN